MSERLFILAIVVLLFVAASLWLRRRPRVLSARLRPELLAGLGVNGGPAIIAFSSPDCASCEAAQRPALRDLTARTGGRVQIREVDVFTAPGLVQALSIFSVPSTVVLDRGRVLAVNIGYASSARLLTQLGVKERS